MRFPASLYGTVQQAVIEAEWQANVSLVNQAPACCDRLHPGLQGVGALPHPGACTTWSTRPSLHNHRACR